MTIKHNIDDDMIKSRARIIYPTFVTSVLQTGSFFNDLIAARGQEYTAIKRSWKDQDREAMLKDTGFLYGMKANIVIVPIKGFPMSIPDIDVALLARKLAAYCKKNGCQSVAFARSHWMSLRFAADKYQELLDGMEKSGIEVHEYE